MEKLCSQCNAPITCLQERGCWCAELPNILPIPDDPADGCLCRSCLTKKIELDLLLRGSSDEATTKKRGPKRREAALAEPTLLPGVCPRSDVKDWTRFEWIWLQENPGWHGAAADRL